MKNKIDGIIRVISPLLLLENLEKNGIKEHGQ
jgi:hypothetical protein